MKLRGRFKPSTIVVAVASVFLAVFAVVVLTSGTSSGSGQLQPAQPFSLGQIGHPSTQVSLSGYAGRPVIVNFFASWCGPCQQETPLLAQFYRSHDGKVAVVGIDDNDHTSKALAFLHEKGAGYPVAVDPHASVATLYGVIALPQTFFLNAKHQIVHHVVGRVTARDLKSWAS
ncbi:MAG TPA: TlpA disulfide reductase family protein [Streptosporangiaceae bacterium]|nr:TlpA disulfide reductase family protein [Streptosporangiaceae bacterium]